MDVPVDEVATTTTTTEMDAIQTHSMEEPRDSIAMEVEAAVTTEHATTDNVVQSEPESRVVSPDVLMQNNPVNGDVSPNTCEDTFIHDAEKETNAQTESKTSPQQQEESEVVPLQNVTPEIEVQDTSPSLLPVDDNDATTAAQPVVASNDVNEQVSDSIEEEEEEEVSIEVVPSSQQTIDDALSSSPLPQPSSLDIIDNSQLVTLLQLTDGDTHKQDMLSQDMTNDEPNTPPIKEEEPARESADQWLVRAGIHGVLKTTADSMRDVETKSINDTVNTESKQSVSGISAVLPPPPPPSLSSPADRSTSVSQDLYRDLMEDDTKNTVVSPLPPVTATKPSKVLSKSPTVRREPIVVAQAAPVSFLNTRHPKSGHDLLSAILPRKRPPPSTTTTMTTTNRFDASAPPKLPITTQPTLDKKTSDVVKRSRQDDITILRPPKREIIDLRDYRLDSQTTVGKEPPISVVRGPGSNRFPYGLTSLSSTNASHGSSSTKMDVLRSPSPPSSRKDAIPPPRPPNDTLLKVRPTVPLSAVATKAPLILSSTSRDSLLSTRGGGGIGRGSVPIITRSIPPPTMVTSLMSKVPPTLPSSMSTSPTTTTAARDSLLSSTTNSHVGTRGPSSMMMSSSNNVNAETLKKPTKTVLTTRPRPEPVASAKESAESVLTRIQASFAPPPPPIWDHTARQPYHPYNATQPTSHSVVPQPMQQPQPQPPQQPEVAPLSNYAMELTQQLLSNVVPRSAPPPPAPPAPHPSQNVSSYSMDLTKNILSGIHTSVPAESQSPAGLSRYALELGQFISSAANAVPIQDMTLPVPTPSLNPQVQTQQSQSMASYVLGRTFPVIASSSDVVVSSPTTTTTSPSPTPSSPSILPAPDDTSARLTVTSLMSLLNISVASATDLLATLNRREIGVFTEKQLEQEGRNIPFNADLEPLDFGSLKQQGVLDSHLRAIGDFARKRKRDQSKLPGMAGQPAVAVAAAAAPPPPVVLPNAMLDVERQIDLIREAARKKALDMSEHETHDSKEKIPSKKKTNDDDDGDKSTTTSRKKKKKKHHRHHHKDKEEKKKKQKKQRSVSSTSSESEEEEEDQHVTSKNTKTKTSSLSHKKHKVSKSDEESSLDEEEVKKNSSKKRGAVAATKPSKQAKKQRVSSSDESDDDSSSQSSSSSGAAAPTSLVKPATTRKQQSSAASVSSGDSIPSDMGLEKGKRVRVCWEGFWYPASITKYDKKHDTFTVRYIGPDASGIEHSEEVQRSRIEGRPCCAWKGQIVCANWNNIGEWFDCIVRDVSADGFVTVERQDKGHVKKGVAMNAIAIAAKDKNESVSRVQALSVNKVKTEGKGGDVSSKGANASVGKKKGKSGGGKG